MPHRVTTLTLKRRFSGWERIRHLYVHPNDERDIKVWIETTEEEDAKDAAVIIAYVRMLGEQEERL